MSIQLTGEYLALVVVRLLERRQQELNQEVNTSFEKRREIEIDSACNIFFVTREIYLYMCRLSYTVPSSFSFKHNL